LSGQFLQRSLFAAVDAILGAIVTSHTHRNVTNQPKYGQMINCGLTTLIVSLFSLCRLRITTQLRSGAVGKMAVFFTKRTWQPYICQPNELEREIRTKTGGSSKNLGGHGPLRPPFRIVTADDFQKFCGSGLDSD